MSGQLFVGLPVNARATDAATIKDELEKQTGLEVFVIVGATSLVFVPGNDKPTAKKAAAS